MSDSINRQDAINAIERWIEGDGGMFELGLMRAAVEIKKLPSTDLLDAGYGKRCYQIPDGGTVEFKYNQNGVGMISIETMDNLMSMAIHSMEIEKKFSSRMRDSYEIGYRVGHEDGYDKACMDLTDDDLGSEIDEEGDADEE